MGKKKKKNKKPLPLWLSGIAFLYIWYVFAVLSIGFAKSIGLMIISPTAFGLFMLPIIGAAWFLIGILMLVMAGEVSKGIKGLKECKKKQVKRKPRKKKK